MDQPASPTPLPFFIYGTLLPDEPNAHVWGDTVAAWRPARYPNGRLVAFSHFPMLIEPDVLEPSDSGVKGQIVEIKPERFVAVLRRLDHLEGVTPNGVGNFFRREKRVVQAADGSLTAVWLYVGRQDLAPGCPIIPDGDWLAYSRSGENDRPLSDSMTDWWESYGRQLLFGDE